MNILILSLYSPTRTNFHEGIGGVQEVLYQLGIRWIGMGHKVKIISAYRDKNIPREEVIDGIEIERVGSFYNAIISIRKAYKDEEKWADIVLENYTSYPLYTPLYVKKPLITIMHHLLGREYVNTAGMTKGAIGYLGERTIPLFYKNTNFIVVSEFSRNQLLNLEIRDINTRIIPNGVNINYYAPAEKASYPLIFFVGGFIDGRKRVDDLLAAFEMVAAKIPNAELVIAGSGGDKETIVKEATKSNSKIKYLGSIDAETKEKLYQKAWVFVNPSIAEGFSLSCLEANAYGTPAVVYNLKGLETIQHGINGLVVEQRNVDELAKTIIVLLTNQELRKEMSKNAKKFAENFSWDVSAREYLKELKNLCPKLEGKIE